MYQDWEDTPPLPARDGSNGDATLFRDTFSGSFFGLSQSIEIDALRYSIDSALTNSEIDDDQHKWLILALAVALNRCTASTGHFAQPLTAKKTNIKRFAAQRFRSIRECWLAAIDGLNPIGNADWRAGNRAMRGEANAILNEFLDQEGDVPTVVYADPPYTDDQYSRYYHVYETLIRYDYPDSHGRGRYRPDREVSSFSLATKVSESLQKLVATCSEIGAELVLSYPTNGLLKNSREAIPEWIKASYGTEAFVTEVHHKHSTMGGSRGHGKRPVTEVIYRARH